MLARFSKASAQQAFWGVSPASNARNTACGGRGGDRVQVQQERAQWVSSGAGVSSVSSWASV